MLGAPGDHSRWVSHSAPSFELLSCLCRLAWGVMNIDWGIWGCFWDESGANGRQVVMGQRRETKEPKPDYDVHFGKRGKLW